MRPHRRNGRARGTGGLSSGATRRLSASSLRFALRVATRNPVPTGGAGQVEPIDGLRRLHRDQGRQPSLLARAVFNCWRSRNGGPPAGPMSPMAATGLSLRTTIDSRRTTDGKDRPEPERLARRGHAVTGLHGRPVQVQGLGRGLRLQLRGRRSGSSRRRTPRPSCSAGSPTRPCRPSGPQRKVSSPTG